MGVEQSKNIEKRLFLQLIDQNWKMHIQYLEQLRQVIGLRSYGQRDPLIEYKKEAFNLFEELLNKTKKSIYWITITILKLLKKQTLKKKEEKQINQKFDKRY